MWSPTIETEADIIFNPPINVENKYIDIMGQPLKERGFRVHALDNFFASREHFKSIRLVHLNWFENVDDSSFLSAFRSFVRKMIVLSAIHWGKKILIWTMHNRTSHEKKSGFFSRVITRYLILWSDAIIIHSQQSRSLIESQYPAAVDKLVYLPHPDFIGNYGPIAEEVLEEPQPLPLKLLFIGAVKPYKNIELLIQAVGEFQEAVSLTIAGKPNTSEYKQRITELANSAQNIRLKLEFIPDDELPRLMQESDLLVLPYDLNSSLNSGTVILAFSYKKTVICPVIGTIEDLKEAMVNVFHYTYQSDEEHLEQLKLQIDKAVKMKREDSRIFNVLGDNMFHHVEERHNKKNVGERLVNVYRSLLD